MKRRTCGKRKYQSAFTAQIALAEVNARGRAEKKFYYCKECRAFHLTSAGRRLRF